MTRRAVVLGAGGVLGAAWTIGALSALEEVEGFDVRSADLIVGTSAGAVLAALLAAGLDVQTLRNHQLGLPLPGGQTIVFDHDTATGTAQPPRPRWGSRPGSPALLGKGLRRPGAVPLQALFWASVPAGRRRLDSLRELVDSLTGPGAWAPRDGVWLVAMDYRTGERVAFGRPGAPRPSLSAAVVASCAVPGWYAPEIIDGSPYVDGGVRSAASVDLLTLPAPPNAAPPVAALDEVYVLAPLAARGLDRPATLAGRLERRWRQRVTRRLLGEVQQAQQARGDRGLDVRVLAPGPSDLALFGTNIMDPSRRVAVLNESLRSSAALLRGEAAGLQAGS